MQVFLGFKDCLCLSNDYPLEENIKLELEESWWDDGKC